MVGGEAEGVVGEAERARGGEGPVTPFEETSGEVGRSLGRREYRSRVLEEGQHRLALWGRQLGNHLGEGVGVAQRGGDLVGSDDCLR